MDGRREWPRSYALEGQRAPMRPAGRNRDRNPGGPESDPGRLLSCGRCNRCPARITESLAPSRLGSSFRWLLSAIDRHERRRWYRDRRRSAARRLADTRPVARLDGAAERAPARLLFGVLAGAVADRFDRRRMVVAVNLGRAFVLAALAATVATGTLNIALILLPLFVLGTAETFADVGQQHPPAAPRPPRGPRRRQRPAARRLPAHEPAAHATDRCLPLHRRHGPAVRDECCLFRARRAARLARRRRRSPSPRTGSAGPSRRHGRGRPLAHRPPADADARADDLHLQRHVRSGLGGARPLRRRPAWHGRGRVRPAHDGDGRRRNHRVARLWPARAAVLAGRHHAGRAADRDRYPLGSRDDDVIRGCACDARRLRRARVRLAHDVDRRPPTSRSRTSCSAEWAASTGSPSSAAW